MTSKLPKPAWLKKYLPCFLTVFFGSSFTLLAISAIHAFEIPIPDLPNPSPFLVHMTLDQYHQAVKSTVLARLAKDPHPDCPLDLSKIRFDHSKIGFDFTHSEERPSREIGSIFDFCNLEGEDFNFSFLHLSLPPLEFLRFIGANLKMASFSDRAIKGGDFCGASLVKSNFNECTITFTRFRSANMSHASFRNATIKYSSILNCYTEGANFERCRFIKCRLSRSFFDTLQKVPEVSLEECEVIS